jgi:hypothetical protein
MKLILTAAVSGALLLPIPKIAYAVPFTNLGEGNTTCGQWLDDRKASPDRVLHEGAWTLGYVTAASRFRAIGTPNFARGVDGHSVDHWLDNYCSTHPLDNIQTAADELVTELRARAERKSN